MRIGVLDLGVGRRFLPFWEPFLEELGAELVRPGPGGRAASPVDALQAGAEELKRAGVDHVLIPDLQLGVESEAGSGACPWVRDPAAFLREVVAGLPPVLVVPGELGPDTPGAAARVGAALAGNPQEVRLALERTRSKIRPPGPFAPGWARREAPVGVYGPPYLLEDDRHYRPLAAALGERGLTLPWRSPAELREEGARLGLRLKLPTDLEWAGAAHALARRHDVAAVLLLHDPDCPASQRVARRIAERLPKPGVPASPGEDPGEVAGRLEVVLGGG